MCLWFGVSRSGFYAWLKREESQRAQVDRELSERIRQVHKQSKGVYGSPRVYQALLRQGVNTSEKRVERLMREMGLVGRVVTVTRRQPGLKRFKEAGENLRLNAPEVDGPDQQWLADVTYLKLDGVWLYLAVVMDVYSRRILGWSLARHRTTELTLAAFGYALKKRQIAPGCLFHTDRGIEYTGYRFRDVVIAHGFRPSFNRPGFCTDNAHMESFFHSLKGELIRGTSFHSEKELRYSLNKYINHFYNNRRLHSGIGYHAPVEYERMAA